MFGGAGGKTAWYVVRLRVGLALSGVDAGVDPGVSPTVIQLSPEALAAIRSNR